MNSLTIAYCTSRREPEFNWYFDSLRHQLRDVEVDTIVVDAYVASRHVSCYRHVAPKPTIWQGAHRLTKEDWWAKSNALNTAIALCRTEWIAFVDDRSILWRAWLDRVKVAMQDGVAVCGSYAKYANLEVTDGVMTGGTLLGADTRTPGIYPFDSWYGGSGALPLEWCLAVNGFPELCDSLGLEDSMFGTALQNSGYPIRYDSDMLLIEDRTPGQIDGALRRADKGGSPKDKSHAIVDILRNSATSLNPYSLRDLRNSVLAGEPFPTPDPGEHRDWYDGQLVSEF